MANFKSYILLLFSAVSLLGCTAPPVKKVNISTPISLSSKSETRSVAIKKVVAKIPRGKMIGQVTGGALCIVQPGGEITWGSSNRVNFTTEELIDIFVEELESAGWPVVGTTEDLFSGYDLSAAEILLAAQISDANTNICYPLSGFGNWSSAKGEMYIKVEWQVYSPRTKEVIGTLQTEGSSVVGSSSSISGDLLANSFSVATRNLLAQQDFHDLVKKVDEIKPKEGVNRIIIRNKNLSLGSLEDAKKSVVSIRTATGHGSGVAIGDGGMVLTNAHVVGSANKVTIITSDGVSFPAEVIRSSKERDIALISLGQSKLKPLPLRLDRVTSGSEVYAIGSPLAEDFIGTVTKGIISGVRKYDGLDWYQSDVAVNPGNSGGPLLDEKFNVIGLTTIGIGGVGSGINLFVPINDGLDFLAVTLD